MHRWLGFNELSLSNLSSRWGDRGGSSCQVVRGMRRRLRLRYCPSRWWTNRSAVWTLLSGRRPSRDLPHPRLVLLLLTLGSRLHTLILAIRTYEVGDRCWIDAALAMDHTVSAWDRDMTVLLRARPLVSRLGLVLRNSLSRCRCWHWLAGAELTRGLPRLRGGSLVRLLLLRLLWLARGRGLGESRSLLKGRALCQRTLVR